MTKSLTKSPKGEQMSRVRTRDTEAELCVQRMLRKLKVRFVTSAPNLPGRPDIVLIKSRCAVFVNGCFWHGHNGCSRGNRPSTNRRFWNEKIKQNILRDKRSARKLRSIGFKVFTIWECTALRAESLERRISSVLRRARVAHGSQRSN